MLLHCRRPYLQGWHKNKFRLHEDCQATYAR